MVANDTPANIVLKFAVTVWKTGAAQYYTKTKFVKWLPPRQLCVKIAHARWAKLQCHRKCWRHRVRVHQIRKVRAGNGQSKNRNWPKAIGKPVGQKADQQPSATHRTIQARTHAICVHDITRSWQGNYLSDVQPGFSIIIWCNLSI